MPTGLLLNCELEWHMTKLLGLVAGLVVGGFLFHRFGFDKVNALRYGWQWYQGTVLLALQVRVS